ncbi:MAG TPA: ion channel [Methyloceanibacter sp.]|jgi:hypothetical protein|nr:ion channel [Methyloceanibacter sp.]
MRGARRLLTEVSRVALSLAFVLLVAISTAGIASPLFVAILVSAALAITTIGVLFPVSQLFSIAFANLIAVYAAIFSVFVEKIFGGVDPAILGVAFCIPLVFFVVGCWFKRDEVRAVVAHPALRSQRRVFGAFAWLLPVAIVGIVVLSLSQVVERFASSEQLLLGAMVMIGLIVLTVSRDVAIFLVDTGLLFEEFFFRVSRLAIPAFAFLTFYSLLVILFAAAYRLLSEYSDGPHFQIATEPRGLSISEALYFSIVSISTVGYGDIVPVSSFARLLVSVEVICGFMLLIFGVSELLEYTREHRRIREERASRTKPKAKRAARTSRSR